MLIIRNANFAPGEITKTITVPVIGDTNYEPNETFVVYLSCSTNANIADDRGTGTIINDDIANRTVIFNANGGSGTMSNQTANIATALTTNIFTRNGYAFSGWNSAANGSGTAYADGASYAFAADVTLYAQWTINQYTITFNSNGGSAVSPITQNYGTVVAAPANPTKAGYTFNGWNPAVPATMPAANTTCIAQWTVVPTYTVTFQAGANGIPDRDHQLLQYCQRNSLGLSGKRPDTGG